MSKGVSKTCLVSFLWIQLNYLLVLFFPTLLFKLSNYVLCIIFSSKLYGVHMDIIINIVIPL